jgi:hypothetical protein
LKRRLVASLVLAMMFATTAALSGPAAALPPGDNGNHDDKYSHANNGNHTGAGARMGKYDNQRRGLR